MKVAVEPCGSYNPEKVHAAVETALRAIGFNVPAGKRVLLKPNIIGQNTPDQAATTHPALIDAVCRIFIERGCSISIGDSSAFYQGGCTAEALRTTGIADVAKKFGATLLPFEMTDLRKISSGKYLNPFYATEAVFEHDLVVNLPKLKVHRLARYTGAIKNMYGCIPGGAKQLYHKPYQHRPDYQEFWGKPLVDVYEAVEPRLSIMDAIIGLDRDGPAANGDPRFTGLVLASTSGPALDVVACRIIGFDPSRVPAVREAIERGLVSPELIVIHGNVPSIPYLFLPDLEPKQWLLRRIDDYIFDQFIVTPEVERGACKQCDECIERCAPKAIRYDAEKLPVIDYATCIRCYCCESYCKYGAIRLRGSGVNLIMRAVRSIMKL
ncbi:MAG: DUF362 domain-containing protein [Spirochaetes bacterium]|nr:DUF362 domain-containing protein [Spirochaetota bacterium]